VRNLALVAAVVGALVLAAAGAAGGAASAWCRGAQLHGTFTVVPGSAGAGNIVYRLRLTNVSAASCSLTGLPKVTLLGKTKRALPTHVVAAHPSQLTAIIVNLAHGKSAYANARFSPDVPGTGEGRPGAPCEAKAYWLRVSAPGGGSTLAAIKPVTSVCEHGQLQFDAYASAALRS
jgi:hypothetical protein